jgi:ribosome-binding factor A
MPRRNDRVNEVLRHEISQLLARQIRDPRLNGVISITQVKTSSDLRLAQVSLSVMGDSETKRSALEGIQSASKFLRRELGQRLTLRHTPFLTFVLDESIEEADRLLRIMDHIQDDQLPRSPIEGDENDIGPLASPPDSG